MDQTVLEFVQSQTFQRSDFTIRSDGVVGLIRRWRRISSVYWFPKLTALGNLEKNFERQQIRQFNSQINLMSLGFEGKVYSRRVVPSTVGPLFQ
jgi:hypothetical protein